MRVRHAEREHVVPFTTQMTTNAIVPMEALEEAVTQKAFILIISISMYCTSEQWFWRALIG